jgi:hypothetical protein
VEDPESARELTRNVEIEEVEDLDIKRIAHMVQVVVSKNEIKRREREELEFMNKRGLTSKVEVADRGVAGRKQKEKWNTHEEGVIDGQVDTGWGERGRAGKRKKIVSVAVVKEKGREGWGRGKMRRI